MILEIARSFAWKTPVWIVSFTVLEWVMHRYLLHGRWIHEHVPPLAYIYRRHAIEHHGRKRNELNGHIDLAWIDYWPVTPWLVWNVARSWHGDPKGIAGLLSLTVVLATHRFLWNHWHRAIHGLETDHWTTRLPVYPAVLRNHLRHHENWRTALNVVCVFGELLAPRRPTATTATAAPTMEE